MKRYDFIAHKGRKGILFCKPIETDNGKYINIEEINNLKCCGNCNYYDQSINSCYLTEFKTDCNSKAVCKDWILDELSNTKRKNLGI